ncbi:guanine-specific ribonuclease N1 and T1 [Streptomyces sp. NBC_01267]|uniref:ribonuclease domain-containing protein n=1 Tax=unclassified Streptomyces TaxID=2593676 RepID=UPI002023E482|nr:MULTISPECIES: ribonuclease domain-containing protein [unclassified Streptomyces]WSV58197.1 guanine-specific ribonuclease N1 and T1 [Streptomyces sp. NBC_01014]
MTLIRNRRAAVAAALFVTGLVLPAVSSATAGTPSGAPSSQTLRVVGVIDPPQPVEAFPGQVKKACEIWKEMDWPAAKRPTDYPVVNTPLVIRGSNVYGNRSHDLPMNGHYREYDVNPRTPGTHRDAERLVRDPDTRTVWYTGDHYDNFQEISSGCP